MINDPALLPAHPAGEQSLVECGSDQSIPVGTYAGRVHIEWDPDAPITPMGQMAFFIAFLKTSGLFDSLVTADASSSIFSGGQSRSSMSYRQHPHQGEFLR